MGKTIIKGFKPDGTVDSEFFTTAELVTKLIRDINKRNPNDKKDLCDAEICKRLEEIRLSAEQDDRIRFVYCHALKKDKQEDKEAETSEDLKKIEREVVRDGIKAAKKCVEENHDVDSMLAILKMCKLIGGEKFSVEVEMEEKDK